MLVRVAENVSINMTGIDSVFVREYKTTETVGGGWFSKGTTRTKKSGFEVEVHYRNTDGQPAKFNYRVLHGATLTQNYKDAIEIQNKVLSQAKELENVGATQLLEEAIRNS